MQIGKTCPAQREGKIYPEKQFTIEKPFHYLLQICPLPTFEAPSSLITDYGQSIM